MKRPALPPHASLFTPHFSLFLSTLLFLLFSLPARPATAQLSQISVEGNHFVDESGETIVFRGVSFSDPDRLEKAGHWNRECFEAARDWNANIVRFPVHPSAWRERGEEAYLELLDQGIEWAAELGMYVIIDWHSIGNLKTELFSVTSTIRAGRRRCGSG